jgi:aspartate beta-hydroxylase
VLQAEMLVLALHQQWPQDADVATALARLAMRRGDAARAIALLRGAALADPSAEAPVIDLAMALLAVDRPGEAVEALGAALARAPQMHVAWLLLGQLRDAAGDAAGALKAWFQAVTRAQSLGQWQDTATTPAQLLDAVTHAIEQLRLRRRELLLGSYDELRQCHGAAALQRVDRAVTGYLREWDATPPDPRQRPRFFFFPGLPNDPYHDANLQPWADRMRAAFPAVRAEAVRLLGEDRPFQNFIDFRPGVRPQDYLKGHGFDPAWEAFFFYRHGQRFDANHARCPQTSALLESIELCRIAGDAPEICFSVLRPGSEILPHHGVTNVRLVLHLPLVVPADCALNLLDAGEHHWREGELVMFDDTFRHEAWNRSQDTRVILLMDCWNPHLSGVERIAVKQLIETISALHQGTRRRKGHEVGT